MVDLDLHVQNSYLTSALIWQERIKQDGRIDIV